MLSINPKEISPLKLQSYLQTAVSPRPIAFASTMDEYGNPNLSPFSFFNVFSSNPPILIFSPARRVRNNTIKHTLINAQDTREVVINIVNYDMVQQMSLSSTEYPKGVNEFVKAGFTMLKSEEIKPFRVAESPVQFECVVKDVIFTGNEGGAGNLIICEVVKMKDAPEVPGDFDMILQNAEGEKKQIYFNNPEVAPNNAILDELETFADAINNNTTPIVTLEDGTEALRVAYQIIDCMNARK